MLVLLPLIVLLFIADVLYLIRGKWKISLFLFFVLLIVNYYTETIPVNVIKQNKIEKVDLSVLCYNVKSSGTDYLLNQERIAEEILREHPDVAFLCEFEFSRSKKLDSVLTHQGCYTRQLLQDSYSVFFCKIKCDSVEGIATGFRDKSKSLTSKIQIKHSLGAVSVIGCHLSSSRKDVLGGYKRRKIEADSIYNFLLREENPIIIMGDMNDFSGSYPINRLKKVGLKDAWWEGGCGYGGTFHSMHMSLRLDHILYQYGKLKLEYVKVIEADYSDHKALMAGFSIIKY